MRKGNILVASAILFVVLLWGKQPLAFADTASDYISWGEFVALPGETKTESVSIEIPEFRGHSQHIATRLRKHTNQADVMFLVFDLNGKQVPLFLKVTPRGKQSSQFVFSDDGTHLRAYSNNVNAQFVYDFLKLPSGEGRILRIRGVRFFFECVSADGSKRTVVRTFFLNVPISLREVPSLDTFGRDNRSDIQAANNPRFVRVFVYVENFGRATLCRDKSEVECRGVIEALFEPAVKRFEKEFGIMLSVESIEEGWPLNPSFAITADDKEGLETLHMYHMSLDAFAEKLRRTPKKPDIVVGIAEGLPPGSSDMASSYYGTVLMNVGDPFLERNLIHEFGHIFCATDTKMQGMMMNGRGSSMEDIFSKDDIAIIMRNKNRSFSDPWFHCK